jgi:hypothetical protein
MNKYQEALLELGKYTVVLSWSKNQTCSINELNEFKLLQELVDKETKEKTTPIHELINDCIELLKISGDNTKSKVLNKLLDFKHRYLDE